MAVAQIKPGNGAAVDVQGTPNGAAFRVTKHPEFTQSVSEALVFTGANIAATPVTTQAGLSATTPVLTLSNPVGSGVNLYLLRATVAFAAAPAALCNVYLAYQAGVPTALTSANVLCNLIGNTAAPQGLCSAVATLAAAPKVLEHIGGIAAATYTGVDGITKEYNGIYCIAPGACITIQTSSVASLLCSFTWKEIPQAGL